MPTHVTARAQDCPVTLQEAKAHLRVLNGENDVYIQSLIEAATEYCEGVTGRSLRVSETVVQTYDCWPGGRIEFDRQPVISVTSFKYYDSDDVLQTVVSTNYRLLKSRNAAARLEFDGNYSYPSHYYREDAIQLTYFAGYESLVDVPAAGADPQVLGVPAIAKSAVKLKTELLFGNADPRMVDGIERAIASLLGQLDWGCYR
jgi:uncharacterized phiE125 gp8 family phage protein